MSTETGISFAVWFAVNEIVPFTVWKVFAAT